MAVRDRAALDFPADGIYGHRDGYNVLYGDGHAACLRIWRKTRTTKARGREPEVAANGRESVHVPRRRRGQQDRSLWRNRRAQIGPVSPELPMYPDAGAASETVPSGATGEPR